MATELLPIANADADSADFTLADGESATVHLTTGGGSIPMDSLVRIQIKDSGGGYTSIARLDVRTHAVKLSSPGTYRARRHSSPHPVGVQRS